MDGNKRNKQHCSDFSTSTGWRRVVVGCTNEGTTPNDATKSFVYPGPQSFFGYPAEPNFTPILITE
jgi:hypothetical protein